MKLTSLALLGLLLAGASSAALSRPNHSADEREIRSLEDRERTAVLAEDTVALARIWAVDLIVNNPQNAVSADRAAVFALIAAGRIRHARFERRIEALRIAGDIAIVMGGETVVARVSTGLAPAAVERRFTHAWRRTSAGWRLLARHANIIPAA